VVAKFPIEEEEGDHALREFVTGIAGEEFDVAIDENDFADFVCRENADGNGEIEQGFILEIGVAPAVLCFAELGDVDDVGDEMGWFVIGAANECDVERAPDGFAGAMEKAFFGAAGRDFAGGHFANEREAGMKVVRMNEVVGIGFEHFIGGVAEDGAEGGVDLKPAAFGIDFGHADGGAFEHAAPLALLFGGFGLGPMLGFGRLLVEDVSADLAGESFEAVTLRRGEVTRAGVENADGAEELVVFGGDGHAGEETEMRSAGDERAGGESGIGAQVGNFEGATLGDREGVEGEIEIEFVGIAEIVGEAPALLVARTDESNRGLAEGAGEMRDVV